LVVHLQPRNTTEIEQQKPDPKRNPSIFYWSNDGGDDQFLGESKSPQHFLGSLFIIMLIVVGVLGTCAKLSS